MKISYQAILLSAMAIGLCACSEDAPWSAQGEGGISLRLSASADVKDALPILRGEAPALVAPEASAFSVSLTNLATSEVKTWPTLADFQNQKSFPTGAYTLTAFYGDPDSEGFEKPYFKGEAEIQVLEARNTEAEVIATLANSMVSIDYTDRFKDYFKDYGVTVHSEGHSYVEFAKDETRPAFIAPGEVAVSVNLTNPSGKSVTLQPAAFPATARYHYHLTFDVNSGTSGDAQLQILFDESLTQDDVTIELTDELFSSPAPSVTPNGFTDGQNLELLSGSSASSPLKFDIIARGGISSAKLTISGDGLTLPFGNEVELVNASPQLQSQLQQYGISALGLFKNPETLANVDISGLSTHLPDGNYSVSLVVKDPYTRISEPVTLNISTVPVELSASAGTAIFNSGQTAVQVAYNGYEPEKNIRFKAMASTGVYKDCEILKVTEVDATRSFDVKNYIFLISLPDTDRSSIPVKMYFGDTEKQEMSIDVVVPQFSVDIDPFATYARVRVNPENAADLASIVSILHLATGNTEIPESSLRRSPDTGIITVYGLEPGKDYTLYDCLTAFNPSKARKTAFSTEADTNVPNGDFSAETAEIDMKDIWVGGEYTGTIFGSPKYHYSTDIIRSIPTGWASVNGKTCWTGSNNLNTWFCVPSTFVENGVATIRSVGYNHSGSTPGVVKKTAQYYNDQAPAFGDSNKSAGELFLGSYTFDGSEHRSEGTSFASRPQSLSFDYSYSAINGEKGKVEVAIMDASGNILASAVADLEAAGSMTSKTLTLSGYAFGSRAASIKVKFVSSGSNVPAINVPSGSSINEYSLNGIGNGLKNNKLSANSYHTFASGSELKVRNVKLNY